MTSNMSPINREGVSMNSKRQIVALHLVLALLAVCLAAPQLAIGQQVTAAIAGKVSDQSDAAIAGATVTAKDVDRGTVFTTESNAQGLYNLPRVPVGRYEIRAEAKGFQTQARPPFTLELNQTARADFQMRIGAVAETVEVTSDAPLLQTDSTQLGTVINSNTTENLPLASRNYVQLTLLAPGAVTPSPSGFTSGVTTGLGPGG